MDESYPLTKAPTLPDVELRPGRAEDFAFVWGLYRRLMRRPAQELGLWHETAQRAMVRSAVNGDEVSIIMTGGNPIGWLQVQDAGDAIYLHQLYIAADHQNRGIGTEIISDILRRARRRSKPVHLWVMRNNSRARRLYERLGFAVVDEDRVKFHLAWEPG